MFDFLVTNQLARFAVLALIFAVVIIGVVSVGRLSARRVEAR